MILSRLVRCDDQSKWSFMMYETIAGWLSALWGAFDALVFPWLCPICGVEASGSPFCPRCRKAILERSEQAALSSCPRCALTVGPFADLRGGCAACRERSLGFDSALALGPYEGTIRDLCLRLKHEKNAWLAPQLSDLFLEARHDALTGLPADVWVVPIPLHWSRRWRRGYNQAEALASGLARRLDLPVRQPLRRIIATEKLGHKGRTERADVMRGVFRARDGRKLAGRTVILVDDVLTTGATCSAAAKALKKAGASRVIVVVIGRAERKTL
jgi:ComF family protein